MDTSLDLYLPRLAASQFVSILQDKCKSSLSQFQLAKKIFSPLSDAMDQYNEQISPEKPLQMPYISDKWVSRICSKEIPVPKDCMIIAKEEAALKFFLPTFQEIDGTYLTKASRESIKKELSLLIQNDQTLADATKQQFLDDLEEKDLPVCLSLLFCHCLTVENRDFAHLPMTQQSRIKKNAALCTCWNHLPVIPQMAIACPELMQKETRADVANQARYQIKLLESYGDYTKETPFSKKMLDTHPRLKNHFKRSCSCFLQAECLRRKTRDGSISIDGRTNMEPLYNRIENNVHDAVIDELEKPYPNGYERCLSVTSKARQLPLLIASTEPICQYIQPNVYAGMIHDLVNQNRIKGWNDDDL